MISNEQKEESIVQFLSNDVIWLALKNHNNFVVVNQNTVSCVCVLNGLSIQPFCSMLNEPYNYFGRYVRQRAKCRNIQPVTITDVLDEIQTYEVPVPSVPSDEVFSDPVH